MKSRNNGFSLVELIIVIAIIAILAAAIAPALVRYIDKSRKAVDIESAEVIFKAAQLASTSEDEKVAEGWALATTISDGSSVARTVVTDTGHNASLDTSYSGNTYTINCVAWARGVNYGGNWQNAQFKSTLDGGGYGDSQRQYTNLFLSNLLHDGAVGGVYYQAGKNNFDGKTSETILMKYTKDAGYGQAECWMVCVRSDNLQCEVWIGDKNYNGRGSGQLVRPLYRVYPDPCNEYRN